MKARFCLWLKCKCLGFSPSTLPKSVLLECMQVGCLEDCVGYALVALD